MTEQQNKISFQIKNPTSNRNTPMNVIAMKRIENYSYALSDEIGLGFTSHVYKGKCELTNKQVAVKVIELKNTEDQLHANFLKQEVAVLEKIKNADHTNLLKLECVIQSKNNLYIITEFCEGNDVGKILRKKKRFSQSEAQSIMKQMLNGYKELYNLRIVHRDLKLANIFITKGQVKIADFGFAISEERCETKFDYNVGSPYYMPPQSLKHNKYSFLSDVWAMGVIAYQLVYGRVPWKDKDDSILYNMITACPIEKLFDSDKEVSEHYQNFIRACLTVDPNQRASPSFIIKYQWPMAREYVEGLEEPNRFSSVGHMPNIHRSIQKIPSNISNISNLSKQKSWQKNQKNNEAKSPAHPKVTTMTEISQFYNKAQNPYPQKHIILDKVPQVPQVPQVQEQNNSQSFTEQAILGQIHYCRFMYQLYRIVSRNQLRHNQAEELKVELSSRLAYKISILVTMAQTQQNLLKSPGFNQYLKSVQWESITQIIYKYDQKYRQQMKNQQIVNIQSFDAQRKSPVFQIIADLKTKLPENLKLIEFLTYYYQIKEDDMRNSPHHFYERTKLEYIVDECQNFGCFAPENVPQNCERLIKKLAILGF